MSASKLLQPLASPHYIPTEVGFLFHIGDTSEHWLQIN